MNYVQKNSFDPFGCKIVQLKWLLTAFETATELLDRMGILIQTYLQPTYLPTNPLTHLPTNLPTYLRDNVNA